MDKLCAWCGAVIPSSGADSYSDPGSISHGICSKCAKNLFADLSEPLNDYLDRFELPILVIDENEDIIAANKRAMKNQNISPESLKGLKCGDVLECIHADTEGGCGKTVHCHSCVIRNTVLHTYRTGKPLNKISAVPDLSQYNRDITETMLISTEKIGNTVILKIEKQNQS